MPPHTAKALWDDDIVGDDPLSWSGYRAPAEESVVTGRTEHYAFVEGRFDVLGGSMGAAHGERVVRAYRRAVDDRLPMVVLAASGGARMQEGMVALVQMARCAAAAADHAAAGLLSAAVYRQPTTGGVLASYASLVDVRAARTGATVGFAGPRVVELTTGQALPAGSHTAESAYGAGLVDAVVDENGEARWLESALGLRREPLDPGWTRGDDRGDWPPGAWGEVQRARSPMRPSGLWWAARLCGSWLDLHGPDPTVRAGLATLDGRRLVVVANDRHAPGTDGRPLPAGFRLARRAISLAARLGLPLLTLVDTPGAQPGAGSEAGGIASEIARTFAAMATLPSPSVSVCVGEGGSGGALSLAAADVLLIQRHAVFSVIAPEGAAAILERDATRAPEVAERLRLTSSDLLELGVVDVVVDEDGGNHDRDVEHMRSAVVQALDGSRPGDRRLRFDRATARWLR